MSDADSTISSMTDMVDELTQMYNDTGSDLIYLKHRMKN